jgi:hypothetical protein
MGRGTPIRNQLGFVEAYLAEYDAVLRQHGAQNAVYFILQQSLVLAGRMGYNPSNRFAHNFLRDVRTGRQA